MSIENIRRKRESGITRIVGVEESVEQELLEYFQRQFEKDQGDSIEQGHPPELDAMIPEINEKMKDFLARYGIQSLEIPSRNIHALDKSKLSSEQRRQFNQRYEKNSGIYLPGKQHIGVFLRYMTNYKLIFAQTLIHEMIHMNAFASAQKVREGGLKLTKDGESIYLAPRRLGFEIDSVETGKRFFRDINEAVTEELMIRFDQNYFLQFEDLRMEYEERKKAISSLAKRAGKNEKDLTPVAYLRHPETNTEGENKAVLLTYGYHDEREQLKKLINDLWEKNKDEFESPEDVFTLFAKAALSGRLLPVARLIEKTYGRGSFRELGERTKE